VGKFLPEGEIVAIVITIAPDFIGIIIIISITSTFISTITTPSVVTS
jgi:hypothetical protein